MSGEWHVVDMQGDVNKECVEEVAGVVRDPVHHPGYDEPLYNATFKNTFRPMQVNPDNDVDPTKAVYFFLEALQAPSEKWMTEVKLSAKAYSNQCNCCASRIGKFLRMAGEGNCPLVFGQKAAQNPTSDALKRLTDLREEYCRSTFERKDYCFEATSNENSLAGNFKVTLMDKEFIESHPAWVGKFEHIYASAPENMICSPEVSRKLKMLLPILSGGYEHRFQRLVENLEKLEKINTAIPSLTRPDHWKAVTKWALAVARFWKTLRDGRGSACGEGSWNAAAVQDKFKTMMFGLATGRSNNEVHIDLQQASNLVDFLALADNTSSLKAEMDSRSDPATYQVSRVAELLRQKCVTSLCTVTLSWGLDGAPNKSDLDIHTFVRGSELYYGNPRVGNCKLDFDANAGRVERNPAENISFNEAGTFEILVNNYCNRDGCDVPFTITVRKPGFTEVHNGVFPKSRRAGNKLHVCRIVITEEDLRGGADVELTEAERKKLANKEAEWQSLFGEPESHLVYARGDELVFGGSSDAASTECPKVLLVSSRENRKALGLSDAPQWAPHKENDADAANKGYPKTKAQSLFGSLLQGNAVSNRQINQRLSGKTGPEKCDFESLDAFVQSMTVTRQENRDKSKEKRASAVNVEVFPRDHVPAYVTRVATKTEVLSKEFAVNAYHRKHEIPQLPRSDEPSTARFDEAWGVVSASTAHNSRSKTPVHGFVKLNGSWFMLLKNAKLPGAAGNTGDERNAAWPLAGGMYPTHLNNEGHHHRSKWTSFHGMCAPKTWETGGSGDLQPLIGSALVGFPSFTFVVNGEEVTVRNA